MGLAQNPIDDIENAPGFFKKAEDSEGEGRKICAS
jgi:hypothetical protein